MKTSWIAMGLVVMSAWAWAAGGDEQPQAADKPKVEEQAAPGGDRKPTLLMRKKLEYAQKILEGLSVEDYEMIGKNARLMNTFAQLENWFWADTPEYRAQLNIFRFANNEMMRMSDEKNLEGVSLAYTQMTLSCVNCHKQIRDKAK